MNPMEVNVLKISVYLFSASVSLKEQEELRERGLDMTFMRIMQFVHNVDKNGFIENNKNDRVFGDVDK
jgi:hypothetical protein